MFKNREEQIGGMKMKEQLKTLFIKVFNLNINTYEVEDHEDLFGPGSNFDLDSMDVLSFINELKKEYDLNLGALNPDSFKTIASIEEFIVKQEV